MRHAGETHIALLRAAHAIKIERATCGGGGATLLEIVHRSQVGYKVARALVPKLKSRGHLQIVGERQVEYRNRPVFEYAPVELPPEPGVTPGHAEPDLSKCLRAWTSSS